jgi:hypothetical protein
LLKSFDYFIDECEMDEILGDVVGYSKYCRRILDFKESHTVKINPYIDYRFSISVRNEHNVWSAFSSREYSYAPRIFINVTGAIRIGNNVSLECTTELSPSIIDSISWKHNVLASGSRQPAHIMHIAPLTVHNMHLTYFCEIRYNFVRMIQKAYKLNVSGIVEVKPRLAINFTADAEHLNIKIKFNVSAPIGDRFMPEKMILQYAENNQSTFKFVNRYCKHFNNELTRQDMAYF